MIFRPGVSAHDGRRGGVRWRGELPKRDCRIGQDDGLHRLLVNLVLLLPFEDNQRSDQSDNYHQGDRDNPRQLPRLTRSGGLRGRRRWRHERHRRYVHAAGQIGQNGLITHIRF